MSTIRRMPGGSQTVGYRLAANFTRVLVSWVSSFKRSRKLFTALVRSTECRSIFQVVSVNHSRFILGRLCSRLLIQKLVVIVIGLSQFVSPSLHAGRCGPKLSVGPRSHRHVGLIGS